MCMFVERLLPCLENHLCGFQLVSSSCFTAYALDETVFMAWSDSDNADRLDPGRLPRGTLCEVISGSRAHIPEVLC